MTNGLGYFDILPLSVRNMIYRAHLAQALHDVNIRKKFDAPQNGHRDKALRAIKSLTNYELSAVQNIHPAMREEYMAATYQSMTFILHGRRDVFRTSIHLVGNLASYGGAAWIQRLAFGTNIRGDPPENRFYSCFPEFKCLSRVRAAFQSLREVHLHLILDGPLLDEHAEVRHYRCNGIEAHVKANITPWTPGLDYGTRMLRTVIIYVVKADDTIRDQYHEQVIELVKSCLTDNMRLVTGPGLVDTESLDLEAVASP